MKKLILLLFVSLFISTNAQIFKQYSPKPFSTSETDYYRFRESPCYEKLGFRPHEIGTSGYERQVKKYRQCEIEYYSGLTIKILVILGITASVFYASKKAKGKVKVSLPLSSKCPYCKEKIKGDAVICKHCKSNLINVE